MDIYGTDFTKIVILNLIITFLGYCTVSIILRLKNGKYEYKKGHKLILLNCAIVWLIFAIIKIEIGLNATRVAVLLYYFVNKAILLKEKNEKEIIEEEQKENYDLFSENEKNVDENINSDIEKRKKPIKCIKEKEHFLIKNFYKKNKKIIIPSVISILIIVVLTFVSNLFIPNIETIKDSVVMIETYDKNAQLIGIGSGFCAFKSDYIITNYHVIEGAYSIKIISDNKDIYEVENVLIFNAENDLAILDSNAKFTPLKISNNTNLKVGTKVTAIGSPKGELNTVSTGIISNADEDEVIRISVPISHGSSGGVLLNNKMKVIGITSSGYDDAQNLNFAINVERLKDLYAYYKKNKNSVIFWNSNLEEDYIDELFRSNQEIGLFAACFKNDNIIPKNLSTFYKLTSPIAIIDLTNQAKYLSDEEKHYVAEIYNLLLKYVPSIKNKVVDSEVVAEAEEWKTAQLIFELDILSRYELAIYMIEMDKLSSNEYFDYINDMELGIAEKVILLLSTAQYTPSELNNDDIEEMINWLDDNDKIDYDNMMGILRNLGFSVDYDTGNIWW